MAYKQRILEWLFARGRAISKKREERTKRHQVNLENTLKSAEFKRRIINFMDTIIMLMSTAPKSIKQETQDIDGIETVIAMTPLPNDKAVLYIHGGAWVIGLTRMHKNFAANIAKATQATVYAIDYRLAPEHPFPAGLDDAFIAYKTMLRKGYKPEKITIIGDSAGGNLALALIHKLKDEKMELPGAVIPISAVTDFNMNGESHTTHAAIDPMLHRNEKSVVEMNFMYVRDQTTELPYISPLLGDLSGFPPMLIIVGGREVLLSDSVNLYEAARKAGVDATLDIEEEMFHIYPVFHDILDESKIALGKIALFIHMKTM